MSEDIWNFVWGRREKYATEGKDFVKEGRTRGDVRKKELKLEVI